MNDGVSRGEMMNTSDVLDAHWDGIIPVRPIALAKNYGIAVYSQKELPVASFVQMQPDRRIVFNADDVSTRQRFAIAHSLGHVLMGHCSDRHPKLEDPSSNFSLNATDRQEREANRFAMQLLMPKDSIHLAITSLNATITEIAELFGVSTVALRERMIQLGMISR